MSDVFVSYARPDEPQAERVAEALRGAGYGVWRDDELPAHRAYAEVIEERLKSRQGGRRPVVGAKRRSRSGCERRPTQPARRGTLVQASSTGRFRRCPFNQIQCADLNGWNGERD